MLERQPPEVHDLLCAPPCWSGIVTLLALLLGGFPVVWAGLLGYLRPGARITQSA